MRQREKDRAGVATTGVAFLWVMAWIEGVFFGCIATIVIGFILCWISADVADDQKSRLSIAAEVRVNGKTMNPLYIFDLDGTLADCTHRQPLIQRDKPHWDAFYDACDQDKPIATIMYLLRILLWTGAEVWIFSGRSDRTLAKTADWLQRYGLEPNEYQLVMRPDGDYTPDDELKQRYLDNMLEVDRKRLVCVFDDRDRVVAMWRRNGITCLQVAPGAF